MVLAGCLFPPFLVRSSFLTSSRSTLAYSDVNSSPIPQNNAPCDLLPRTEPPRLGFRFSVFGLNPPFPRAPFNQMAPRTQPWLTPPPMYPLYPYTTFSAVRLWESSLYGLIFSFFLAQIPPSSPTVQLAIHSRVPHRSSLSTSCWGPCVPRRYQAQSLDIRGFFWGWGRNPAPAHSRILAFPIAHSFDLHTHLITYVHCIASTGCLKPPAEIESARWTSV